jgi:hypothetical protein
MEETRGNQVKDCAKELWEIFEKTGSIAAYILYNDMKKKAAKGVEDTQDNEDVMAK